MCGDRVDVFARLDHGRVAAAGFAARGCDITTASADLMCEAVQGLDLDGVRALAHIVSEMARTGQCDACNPALQPFSAIHEYPSRLRCVTLPWSALIDALETKNG